MLLEEQNGGQMSNNNRASLLIIDTSRDRYGYPGSSNIARSVGLDLFRSVLEMR